MRLVSTRHMPKKEFDKLDDETKELYDENLPVELAMNIGRVLAPFVTKSVKKVTAKLATAKRVRNKVPEYEIPEEIDMIEWSFELDIMTPKQREFLNNYLASRMSEVDFIGFSQLMVDFSKDNATKTEAN